MKAKENSIENPVEKEEKPASIAMHLWKLLSKPGDNLASLIFLGDRLSQSDRAREAAADLMDDPAVTMRYKTLDGFQPLDLEKLKELPDNSFGYRVYDFFTSQGLDVYPLPEEENPEAYVYLRERRRKIHDFLHLTLGYGTDLFGEAEVNSFVYQQTKMPISKLIIGGIYLKTLVSKPSRLGELKERIRLAKNRADTCQNLFAYQWEKFFQRPYADVVYEYTKKWKLEKVIAEELLCQKIKAASAA